MAEVAADIERWERRIEDALWEVERGGSIEAACDVYREAAAALRGLEGTPETDRNRQRVLSYALLRHANALRQLGRLEEARSADDEGLEAARRAGDSLSLGRALLSAAGTGFAEGDQARAGHLLEEAEGAFSAVTTPDHLQGLGWCQIIRADVGNAGLVDMTPDEVLSSGDEALRVLEPIENWPGVARAHAAKAVALDALGRQDEATAERERASAVEQRAAGTQFGA